MGGAECCTGMRKSEARNVAEENDIGLNGWCRVLHWHEKK